MIIIDVAFNVLKKINRDMFGGNNLFYMEKGETIELYATMNNILFRSIYKKQDEGKDILFRENNMKGAMQVQWISHVNEPEWQEAMQRVIALLEEIKEGIDANKQD